MECCDVCVKDAGVCQVVYEGPREVMLLNQLWYENTHKSTVSNIGLL